MGGSSCGAKISPHAKNQPNRLKTDNFGFLVGFWGFCFFCGCFEDFLGLGGDFWRISGGILDRCSCSFESFGEVFFSIFRIFSYHQKISIYNSIFQRYNRALKQNLNFKVAQVVKLVDTRDLKSLEGNFVPVQVRPWAPKY